MNRVARQHIVLRLRYAVIPEDPEHKRCRASFDANCQESRARVIENDHTRENAYYYFDSKYLVLLPTSISVSVYLSTRCLYTTACT
jgi:hypothetical protein